MSFQQPTHNSLQTVVGKSVTGNDVLVQGWSLPGNEHCVHVPT